MTYRDIQERETYLNEINWADENTCKSVYKSVLPSVFPGECEAPARLQPLYLWGNIALFALELLVTKLLSLLQLTLLYSQQLEEHILSSHVLWAQAQGVYRLDSMLARTYINFGILTRTPIFVAPKIP